jgi:hypothetical protein
MKVQELIDDLLAVAEPDTEIKWRVVGSASGEVEVSYAGISRGAITTQVDIDAAGELNGVDVTRDGKVRVEVWF